MRKIFYLVIAIMFSSYSSAQITLNSNALGTSATSFAFINGVSSTYSSFNYAGKGFLFPKTDLTAITESSVANGSNNYDGVVVYNTGTGAIPASAMGTSAAPVSPGFYYYRNEPASAARPTVNKDTGVWTPMGGGGGGASTVDIGTTAVDTNVTTLVGTTKTAEKVISVTATADGAKTEITLASTITGFNRFRGAKIYDSTGDLVLSTYGSYDNVSKKLVTSSGVFNIALPATTATTLYTVEFYYN